MKLAIVGSREFTDYNFVRDQILQYLDDTGKTIDSIECIISGGARGVDKLGEKFAYEYHISIKVFEAEWDNLTTTKPIKIRTNKYGKEYNVLAGFNRNLDIVLYVDVILAFWDGVSKGTKSTIDTAKEYKKVCKVIGV